MNHTDCRRRLTFHLALAAPFGLALLAGCGPGSPVAPGSAGPAISVQKQVTSAEVSQVAAELMGVPVSQITPQTSLGDLGADELDFVELVMELEEKYEISIPDDAFDTALNGPNWTKNDLQRLTMARLAEIVTHHRQSPPRSAP